jgi:hypothetical protein
VTEEHLAPAEAVKAAVEILKPVAEHDSPSRPGPLVAAGRFYVSLTVILAAFTSAASFIDWKSGHDPSDSVSVLRWFLVVAILVGLSLPVLLLQALYERQPLFLFSPTELSPELQLKLLPETKEKALELQGKEDPNALKKGGQEGTPPIVPSGGGLPPPAPVPQEQAVSQQATSSHQAAPVQPPQEQAATPAPPTPPTPPSPRT